jgi:hypothetical protein
MFAFKIRTNTRGNTWASPQILLQCMKRSNSTQIGSNPDSSLSALDPRLQNPSETSRRDVKMAVSSARRTLPVLAQFRTCRCVLGDQSADARRGAALGGQLRQAAEAAAWVAADKRGVRWLQLHIHDSPRNQLNSRSIGDGGRAVRVSVNKALTLCDGFSKLLKTLRQRAQSKVRQCDAGQVIYFGRRNRCMIA